MSASDLFKDTSDVDFRLRGTWLMIGREPYAVASCLPQTNDKDKVLIHMVNLKGDDFKVELGRLPLSAMTYCPSGYFEDRWWSRGPARSRYQGLTSSSFWSVDWQGNLNNDGVGSPKTLLKALALQPRSRRPGKRPMGIITKDVMIDPNNRVLVRGRYRGEYVGENTVKMLAEPNPITMQLLDRAKLTIGGK